ncbi:hypothetical protein [Pseudomonas protegens]
MNKGTLTSSSHTLRKAIIAAAIGNFITWFEYASYGFLAAILGRVFFSRQHCIGKSSGNVRRLRYFISNGPTGSFVFRQAWGLPRP